MLNACIEGKGSSKKREKDGEGERERERASSHPLLGGSNCCGNFGPHTLSIIPLASKQAREREREKKTENSERCERQRSVLRSAPKSAPLGTPLQCRNRLIYVPGSIGTPPPPELDHMLL